MDNLKTTQPTTTTKSVEEKTNQCLANLNKICTLEINKCKLTANDTQTIPFECEYNYYFNAADRKNDFNITTTIEKIEDSKCQNSLTNNINASQVDFNCFNTKNYENILNDQALNRSCLVNESSNIGIYNCSSQIKCLFENNTIAEECRKKFQTTAATISFITTSNTSIQEVVSLFYLIDLFFF